MEFPEGGRGIVCGPFLENPEGWGGHMKNPFRGGGMDIFWNHTFSMKYSKEKAFLRKHELLQIEASLKQAEETVITDPSTSNLEKLEKLKIKYGSYFEYIAKGVIVRSRANWYEQGEKSNKYFLGLESNKGTKRCIRKMFTSKGTLTSNQKNAMKQIENFYSNL